MRILIIGGGAAGMAAAICAAREGAKVTLLERMDRVGKKLLATGNGRCNLMNVGPWVYPGGSDFAAAVLARCGAEKQIAFWAELGLRLREEDGGRVYPVSGQAATVLDTLRLAMENLGVEVVCDAAVSGIIPEKHGFTVKTQAKTYHAHRVIAAGGGCAQPKLGSDGSLWSVFEELGHRVVSPKAALSQIMTDTSAIRGLSGIRAKADVTVEQHNQPLHKESGEVLFADYGVSGVCVMQCARYAAKGSRLVLSFLKGMGFADEQELTNELLRRQKEWENQPMEKLLTGLCVPRLAGALCMDAGIRFRERQIGSLTRGEAAALARSVAGFALEVKGVKGFDSAQVTAGGLDVTQFDAATMESHLCPGLYAAGEMLDVDGTCGGFNLMFAFGSGILAARACVEE